MVRKNRNNLKTRSNLGIAIDKKDGIIIDLKEEDKYSFSTEKTGTLNRFLIISKSNQITTSISNQSALGSFYYYDRIIKIIDDNLSDNIEIYDLQGKKVYTCQTEDKSVDIPSNISPGTYIVKIGDVSKKVIID